MINVEYIFKACWYRKYWQTPCATEIPQNQIAISDLGVTGGGPDRL